MQKDLEIFAKTKLPVASERRHAKPGRAGILHLRLLLGREVEEDVGGLLEAEHAALRRAVRELLQVHAREPDALHGRAQDRPGQTAGKQLPPVNKR